MDILTALSDKNLFGPHFKQGDWSAWRAFLRAAFGLSGMTPEEYSVYARCTGRSDIPRTQSSEVWAISGRRSGKSRMLATIAVYMGCFVDFRKYLAPGEVGTIPIIASDKKQARTIFRYCRGLLMNTPMLKRMVARETAESFDLSNGITIEISVASFRAVRGYTVVCALADEVAFWRSAEDSASPDFEIMAALQPAMGSIPGAMLLCASSAYAKKGVLYDAHKNYWGKNEDGVLVWKADTRTMNPTFRQSIIDRATKRDADVAASEYGSEFRADIAGYVDRDVVEACVETGCKERPNLGHSYFAFVDPSGGSSDSMTLAIAHRERDRVIVDVLREIVAPFTPESAVGEFVGTLKSYGCSSVVGDRYGSEWVRQAFESRSIRYDHSEKPKSDLYVDLLPLLNSRQIVLLDNDRAVNQIANLERKTSRGGKDSIDHPPRGRDDLANAIAGVASLCGVAYTARLIERARDPNLEAAWPTAA
jgi:hypothetical protein